VHTSSDGYGRVRPGRGGGQPATAGPWADQRRTGARAAALPGPQGHHPVNDDQLQPRDPRLSAAARALEARDEALAVTLAEGVVKDALQVLVEGLHALLAAHAARQDWEPALVAVQWLKALPIDDTEYQSGVASSAAWVQGHLGLHDESVAEAQASLEFAADGVEDPRVLLNAAFAYSRAGDRPRALELIMRAADLDSDDADVAYDKACHLADLGKPDEALEALQTALLIEPRKVEAALYDQDFDHLRASPRAWRAVRGPA
jgi:tetratricopeptide (TPR) repeat protein